MARKGSKPFSSHSFLTSIGPGKKLLTFGPKQRVFSQGDPADAVFYIQQGTVKLSVLSLQGKEAVVALLKKEHFFGEQCLTGHSLRDAGETQLAKPFRAGVSHAEHENRGRTKEEDRGFRRDAQARRDGLPSTQEMSVLRAGQAAVMGIGRRYRVFRAPGSLVRQALAGDCAGSPETPSAETAPRRWRAAWR